MWLSDPSAWIALATLVLLEIVLGIDNVIFLSILSNKLPAEQQGRARTVGLIAAMVMRILLLFSIAWIIRLTEPIFELPFLNFLASFNAEGGHGGEVVSSPGAISGRDLILLLGGLFLIYKSTREIHENLEGEHETDTNVGSATFTSVILQIMALDIVFSLDSVITAVGMVDELAVMVIAVVIAVGVMLFAAAPIAKFVESHPTVKMLALSFLVLIGTSLIAESLDFHIPKGYVYFAMGFSVLVEMLNLRARKGKRDPVKLRPGVNAPKEIK